MSAPSRARLVPLVVAAALALAYLPRLGAPSGPSRPEEQYNMAVSAEMHQRGAWATPTLDGAPWFYKPPLLYWGERVAYSVFGLGVFGARLPAALAALGVALLVGALAVAFRASGPLAALLAGGSAGLFMNGRLAITDAPLTLALGGAFFCLWEAHRRGDGRWWLASGALVGVGVLAKGPIAAVIFGVGALAFVLLRPRPRPDPLLRPGPLAAAAALAVAVAAPWYALMLSRHGQGFFDFFFVQMNVDRFRTPWAVGSLGVLWGALLGWLAPWTPLALAAVVDALGGERRRDARHLLALCWAGATMLVYSLPAQKFPHYGLPAVPPLALLVALLWEERRSARAFAWGARGTAAVCALGALAAALGARFLPAVEAVALALSTGVAAVAWASRRPLPAAAAGLVAVACALGWLAPAAGYSPWPDAPVPQRPLNTLRQPPGLIELASGRDVRYLATPEAAEEALARGELVWMTEGDFHGPASDVVATQRRLRTAVAPEDLARAVREGSMAPLLGRVLVVGRAAPPSDAGQAAP